MMTLNKSSDIDEASYVFCEDLELNAIIFNLSKRFQVIFSFVSKKLLEHTFFLSMKLI